MFDGPTRKNKIAERFKSILRRSPDHKDGNSITAGAATIILTVNFFLLVIIVMDSRSCSKLMKEMGLNLEEAVSMMREISQATKAEFYHKSLLEMKIDLLQEKIKRVEVKEDANDQPN